MSFVVFFFPSISPRPSSHSPPHFLQPLPMFIFIFSQVLLIRMTYIQDVQEHGSTSRKTSATEELAVDVLHGQEQIGTLGRV